MKGVGKMPSNKQEDSPPIIGVIFFIILIFTLFGGMPEALLTFFGVILLLVFIFNLLDIISD